MYGVVSHNSVATPDHTPLYEIPAGSKLLLRVQEVIGLDSSYTGSNGIKPATVLLINVIL